MSYLLIASRDVLESTAARKYLMLAADLAKSGEAVSVFLVQNAVFAARSGEHGAWLRELGGSGVSILADVFSLRERGILESALILNVRAASLDVIVDALSAGTKVLSGLTENANVGTQDPHLRAQ